MLGAVGFGDAGGAYAGTTIEWWAPGVGLVAWEELAYYGDGPARCELTGYIVN